MGETADCCTFNVQCSSQQPKMVRFLNTHLEANGSNDEEHAWMYQTSETRFYHIERTQICRGYAYVSFACFFFTCFLFFIKISDCSEENCWTNEDDPWNWTLQCLIAVGAVSLISLLLGTIFIKIAKHREKIHGYQPI